MYLKYATSVVGIQQYLIRPNVANTNDNFLSSEILLEPSITEELVRKSLSLDYVIFQAGTRLGIWEHPPQCTT
ncbi:hypothetical protein RUM44_002110 [Polyplax serrata]|uniref:Uncharacterized protein n=1 Tax=Polyplax serrata TaxID=468196 RepID=A0ABR1ANG9_POLSC